MQFLLTPTNAFFVFAKKYIYEKITFKNFKNYYAYKLVLGISPKIQIKIRRNKK